MSVLAEGRIIGGFRIGRMLGHGAMGEVYRAEQVVLARPVAIKRILPQFAGSHGAVERLQREARTLASVKSPYVVQVHDLVQADGDASGLDLDAVAQGAARVASRGHAHCIVLIESGQLGYKALHGQVVPGRRIEGLGRDGTWFIVAAGRANHAGVGAWKGITAGNPPTLW